MSDSNSQSEPTMEEILASIRRIISEDGAEGQEEAEEAEEGEGEEPAAPAAEEPEPEPAAEAEAGGDVLDLTQMVEEDGSVVDLAKERENAQAAAADAGAESEEAAAEPEEAAETAEAEAEVPEAAEESEAPEPNEESLLSDPTRSSAMASFAELAQAAGVHDTGGRLPLGSGLTLEQLVRDALEPYLKSWLDDNLAALVERIVREEVQKLVKRAEYR